MEINKTLNCEFCRQPIPEGEVVKHVQVDEADYLDICESCYEHTIA